MAATEQSTVGAISLTRWNLAARQLIVRHKGLGGGADIIVRAVQKKL